ncbi:MAG: penicillin-binding protein [Patescibacteria group bacterium]|jgi:1A family penicillin-binding protein
MPIPVLQKKLSAPWRDYQKSRGIKSQKPKKRKHLIKQLVITAFLLGIIALVVGLIYIALISRNLPNPNQLINREVAQSTKIYDRTGQTVLYEISGNQRRTLVALKDTPNYVKEATIAIEDKDFYKHGAFSLWSMFRTAVTDILFQRSAGGSTLTQQFVKNAILTSEKTFSRKIKELVLAYRLEQKFSKDDILQMYLNEIPYGSNAYGVEAASQNYFGKDVKNISLAEAAVLAAIVQRPSYYSPYGSNKKTLLDRKDYVLDLMAEQGYISTIERDIAKKEEIKFKNPGTNIIAPHFVMYIKDILTTKYGEQMIEQGGLKIYTTLDLYKQQAAEEAITTITKDYPKKFNANNASLVAIDPKNGQILAMVGSRDYFDDSIEGQFNVATSPRQPGSSMKPIVYSSLFEKGYTPDTILYDVNTNFSTDPKNPYTPHDYDLKERGPVTIRQALAGSLNIPAVKALYLTGVNDVIDLANNLGYTTLYPRNRFGLSLVLGGAEVKLLEHVNAYSAFARDGQLSPIVGILKVEDSGGKILEEYQPSSKKALDSKIVRMVVSILTDNNARSFIFGTKNSLNLGSRPVGAKTGTTNDYHDAWTLGFTPSLVAGVWVGNNDNKKMNGGADGSVVAAPIWHYFMQKVLGNTPIETFQSPGDYKTGKAILDGQLQPEIIKIDKSSELLATSSTPPELIEEKTIPAYHSILYYIDRTNPLGPAPKDPTKDPQFSSWESAVLAWATKNGSSSPLIGTSTLPTTYDNLHNPENKPTIKINSPLVNQIINDSNLEVNIEAAAPRGINRTEYFINNNLWQTRWGAPLVFTEAINFLSNGFHSLKVKTCDDVENCTEASVNFNLLINNNPLTTEKNSINLNYPLSGAVIKASNFPLNAKLTVAFPQKIAKVNLIIKNTISGTSTVINSVNNPSENDIQLVWNTAPSAGNYTIYAELKNWNGDTIKSNEALVIAEQ